MPRVEFGRLTFELSGLQRQDARPGLVKMYTVPPDRAWWPAVVAPLERGVRPHLRLGFGSSSEQQKTEQARLQK